MYICAWRVEGGASVKYEKELSRVFATAPFPYFAFCTLCLPVVGVRLTIGGGILPFNLRVQLAQLLLNRRLLIG